MAPQSAAAYRWKLKPTGPFHHKNTQTLIILLVKVIFLPQNNPNRCQTEGECLVQEGVHPDRRDPDLTYSKYLQNDLSGAISVIADVFQDRKSTRLNSSHLGISYAVFCLKKKKTTSLSTLWTIRY